MRKGLKRKGIGERVGTLEGLKVGKVKAGEAEGELLRGRRDCPAQAKESLIRAKRTLLCIMKLTCCQGKSASA